MAISAIPAAAQERDLNLLVFEEAYLKSPHSQRTENFGRVVAVSGNTAAVAAPNGSAIHVYEKRDGTWKHEARLTATKPGSFNAFGSSVAISGDILVAGARLDASAATGVNGDENDESSFGAGAAYVFERGPGGWKRTAYLKASNAEASDGFGWSVAVSGNTVIIGATGEGAIRSPGPPGPIPSDAAYVFTKTAGVWSEEAYLKASDPEESEFGFSVAISGDTAIVGALDFAFFSTSGSAYVFARGPGGWQEQARLKGAGSPEGFDGFGFAVAASGDTVVVGTGFANGESGSAEVFARSPGGWRRQAYLKASNADRQDFFGGSVAISGDTIVVGAPGESSAATGIDGNGRNNDAPYSGASYVFRRRDDRWSQLAYVKASNAEEGDYFGGSVAISGRHVVIGAERVGHPGDGNSVAPGAAYVFRVLPPRADLEVTRSPGPFAPTRVGSRSRDQALVLRNGGTETLRGLRFRRLGVGKGDFRLRGRVARTLKPGGSTRVGVLFRPSRQGLRRATLALVGNFRTERIVLSGKGLPQIPMSPRLPVEQP